jgi:RNA polymerase sigma factor for flagellar operon FliA
VSDQSLFLSSLPVIDDVTAFVCRRHRLSTTEAEDFDAEVRLHFIDSHCQALRRFEGRSSLKTYLSVVIHRLFLDYRNRLWGKWRPSAEAKRLGPTAILVERLVARDGWKFEQAVEMLRVNHGVEIDGALDSFCARLCARPPGRQLVEESEAEHVESPTPAPDANVVRADQDFLAKRVRTALSRARAALEPEQRLILKMRFDDGVPVVDIARALHLDQKRLYRTIERLLADLCKRLTAEGISRGDIDDLFADGTLSAADARDDDRDDDRDASSGGEPGAVPAEGPAESARTRWQQKH